MGKKKHREMKWQCQKCRNIETVNDRPNLCTNCNGIGTFLFYGAKVVKNV